MKNIQIIDGARNCVFDIYQATDDEFASIFPENTNIAFSDEVWERENDKKLSETFDCIWNRPIKKSEAMGIHGILFYDLEDKKQFYPTRKDEEAINPDGTPLRR
ncbi:hypothetical protein ACFL4M_00800 [Pseudomonadota bacterium]